MLNVLHVKDEPALRDIGKLFLSRGRSLQLKPQSMEKMLSIK